MIGAKKFGFVETRRGCGNKTEHTHTWKHDDLRGMIFSILSGSPSKKSGVRGCALVLSCLSIKN